MVAVQVARLLGTPLAARDGVYKIQIDYVPSIQ